MTRYIARMAGPSWARGPEVEVATITEARLWAEEFGDTADECHIIRPRWLLWGHPDARGTGDWHGGDGVRPAPVPRGCACLAVPPEALVAIHRRDPNGDGRRWYRAEC